MIRNSSFPSSRRYADVNDDPALRAVLDHLRVLLDAETEYEARKWLEWQMERLIQAQADALAHREGRMAALAELRLVRQHLAAIGDFAALQESYAREDAVEDAARLARPVIVDRRQG